MQKLAHRSAGAARLSSFAAGAAALLAPFAVPRAAESTVVLDNLTLAIGQTTWRIPHLELAGATLTTAELADLFKGDEKAVDGRLARLSAKNLVIPSLTAESKVGDETQRTEYRDVRAADIRAGRIASLRAAGAEQTFEKANGGSERYLWGASLAKGVDLRQLVHMALAVRVDPQEALKPLVEEESVESLTLEDKGARLTVTTGRIAATGVKGRALSSPATQLLERLQKYDPDKPEADPALQKDLVDALASIDVASFEIRDLMASGKGEPAEKPYTTKVGRIAASRIAGATVGDFSLDDFSMQSSDGGVIAFRRFALRDARLASFIDNPIPLIGHIGIKGLDGDLPDAHLGEASRMKFSLAGAEADFMNFREIAPTRFSARVDNLSIDLAARGEAPSTAQFLALGYRNLDFSAALAGEWREKTQEAVFAPLRFEGKDMGAATLDVTFGDVSSAVFSAMPVVARAAALASSVKSVALTVEGGGLVDRVLALEARKDKQPLEKARADYAKSAAIVTASLLGGGEKARKVADAVSAYIMAPKRLHVRLASAKGINALDVMGKNFSDLFEGIDVEATADK
ncbi:hypothetical protein ACNHKD_15345 [Methylocystis sp. JAN1]|uniref:hypothetical protein n=1 Tax=Methylocystis sp. JAN1 TaxID=3397211 RepID=UPI003FA332D3